MLPKDYCKKWAKHKYMIYISIFSHLLLLCGVYFTNNHMNCVKPADAL
jgi:hypothetical protein